MTDTFWMIVFGHLVGDYFFQSKVMAIEKSNNGVRGIVWCVIHSLIYTVCVVIFTQIVTPLFIVLVFLSHYPIDRYSLASKWLRVIKGRDFVRAYDDKDKYWEIDVAFSTMVYTVVDNSMHLIMLWFVYKSYI